MSLEDVEIVDKRLRQLYKALSSSLELEHWKFEPVIKEAIAGSDQSFARLCQAAEGLASLVPLHHHVLKCELQLLAPYSAVSAVNKVLFAGQWQRGQCRPCPHFEPIRSIHSCYYHIPDR